MNWLSNFFTSSIGKKVIMSLTGLFLILFLVVHLVGNLQLLTDDGGESFNKYAYFMTHNPLIKTISIGLYFFILLHTVQGILIWFNNRKAKGKSSVVKTYENGNWMSKNMALLGTLIFAFILIHMGDFWYKMKFTDQMAPVLYEGYNYEVLDMYTRVETAFAQPWLVIIYLIGLLVLSLHLMHGFQSAFTTLGIRHKKYTPVINFIGMAYAILIPLGFAIIPIWFLFNK